MKALVTGGAGFIGSNLVSRLLTLGYDVTVLDSLLSGHVENLKELRVEFIEGDVRDEAALARAIEGAHVVFHLAASVGNKRSIDLPLDDADINVMGTLKVLEAARAVGARKLVYSSSAGIFGELKTLPISEDHPIEPDSPYGATKLCGEKLALSYAKIYELQVVCLRYFNVYGVNQRFDMYGNVIPIFAHQMLNGAPVTIFGDGEQTRDFVNVKDVAQANCLAAQFDGSGAYNLGSGDRITINSLVDIMEETSGLSADRSYGPRRAGDVRHSLADISKASKELGYKPTVGLYEGLGEYFDWLRLAARAA